MNVNVNVTQGKARQTAAVHKIKSNKNDYLYFLSAPNLPEMRPCMGRSV